MTAPAFSVIMATWGRGRHILPSVQSVLRQDLSDVELLVVGDATSDDTESVVAGIGDPRVRWLNLAERCGSQSGPNNAGIAAARAGLIAYLGHDDIWEPDHLSRLAALYQGDSAPDFAVSGAIFHLPNDMRGSEVTGIFPAGAEVRRYFFPPSSISHRRQALDRIGPWRMPGEVRAPVDADLLVRAMAGGLTFRSTGAVTVHKFAAGQRYLSYVRQESGEQAAMLADLTRPGHAERVAAKLAEARVLGCFMVTADHDYDGHAKGELARRNARRKGVQVTSSRALGAGRTVRHPKEPAALDWHRLTVLGFRLPKANPKPRLLLPVLGGRARLSFLALHRDRPALGPLELLCNGQPVTASPGRIWSVGLLRWTRYRAEVTLTPDAPSLLELCFSADQGPGPGQRGLAIGPLRLDPV